MSAVPAGCRDAIALLVRGQPYARRSARSELDIALLAASVERPLRLYFLGAAVLQLLQDRETGPAELPAGYRAWASLPELTSVQAFAEARRLDWLRARALPLLLDPQPLSPEAMRVHWRDCGRVLVL